MKRVGLLILCSNNSYISINCVNSIITKDQVAETVLLDNTNPRSYQVFSVQSVGGLSKYYASTNSDECRSVSVFNVSS